MRECIDTLRRESEIISTFVETIMDISTHTNLSSLNASIEAARAGHAGRGFVVVAETVNEVAAKLLENVDKLNSTSATFGENMEELKTEISVFVIG